MFVLTVKFDRKKAVFCVIMVALLLIGLVMLAGAAHTRRELQSRPAVSVKNEASRIHYLEQNGWEVESPALGEARVLIPREFSDVLLAYNELQKAQGFDLSRYGGQEVEVYTYKVPGYEDDEVVAQLYVSDGEVIGGDVHSTRLDGFMTGIRSSEQL